MAIRVEAAGGRLGHAIERAKAVDLALVPHVRDGLSNRIDLLAGDVARDTIASKVLAVVTTTLVPNYRSQ